MMLYRKISCSDRLPTHEGIYNTDDGELLYFTQYNRWGGSNDPSYPLWWIETVPEISNEEINIGFADKLVMESKENMPKFSPTKYRIFLIGVIWGFKKAIEILNGK